MRIPLCPSIYIHPSLFTPQKLLLPSVTMRTSFWIVFCLLVMTFHLASQAVTGARPITIKDGRYPIRRLSPQEDGKQFKAVDDLMEKDNMKVRASEGESENGDDGEGLIYNVDYHGVTTHPSPSPKHPKPRN